MDVLHQDTLVLEHVTLAALVELMIAMRKNIKIERYNAGQHVDLERLHVSIYDHYQKYNNRSNTGQQLHLQMSVYLLRLAVLAEKAAENSLSSHPDNLLGETGIGSTLSLSTSHVATLAASLMGGTYTCAGMDYLGLADDQTILDQFADVLPYNIEHTMDNKYT